MKLYVREHSQKHYCLDHCMRITAPNAPTIKPGDSWCRANSNYYVDKVMYSKDNTCVYMTKQFLKKLEKSI